MKLVQDTLIVSRLALLYAAETWMLTQTDRRRSEAFELWIWRRMEQTSWLDKVTNEKVLRRVNEDRQILNSIWQRKLRWIEHISRHNGLLCEITEGRMKGKPTRGRRRIQMLHDLTNDDGFVALKRAAREREGRRHRERMSKTCSTAEDHSDHILIECVDLNDV